MGKLAVSVGERMTGIAVVFARKDPGKVVEDPAFLEPVDQLAAEFPVSGEAALRNHVFVERAHDDEELIVAMEQEGGQTFEGGKLKRLIGTHPGEGLWAAGAVGP